MNTNVRCGICEIDKKEEKRMDNNMKKLTRSTRNRMMCGVCGGIGEYLNVDPTLVRLIWALCSLASVGMGVILYIVAAIVMPEDNQVVG